MTRPTKPNRIIQRGPISNALDAAVERKTRFSMKADVHAAALVGKASTIDVDGVTAHFTPPRVRDGILETRVTMAGLPVGANPFQFVNPPILVPVDGEEDSYREDPEAAFRIILADAIRGVLRVNNS